MADIRDDEAVRVSSRASWSVRGLGLVLCGVLTLGSVAEALDLFRAAGIVLLNEQLLAAMLGVGLAALYLLKPARAGAARLSVPWYDWIAAGLGLGTCLYVAWNYESILDRLYLRPPETVALGAIILVLVVEGLRRTVGSFLFWFVLFFVAFGFFGYLIPGHFQGQQVAVDRLLIYLGLDSNGLLGIPLTVVFGIVIPFVYFGNLLERSGGAQFFTDISAALMGRYRGGSAKIAIVASSLFGAISGSAVSNVVSTGVVTIPLMRKAGYPAHTAAAIEAVASTGGQLMPPMMGAAAFLVAEFLERPYTDVVLAAIIPALLYYTSLFIQADLIAARDNLPRVDPSAIPKSVPVLKSGWPYVIPFAVIVIVLFGFNVRPQTAAMWAIGTLIPVGLFVGYRGQRMAVGVIVRMLGQTGAAMIQLLMVASMAGIVIGVLNITGLGFALTQAIITFAAGSKFLILVLAAAISIFLGMGMPTVGVYLLLATLVIPSMVEAGIHPFAAHMFAFYFGILSMITPPVAAAAFAAATLAECNFMRTGWSAVTFGWPAYVVPFLFVLSPQLLMMGSTTMVLLISLTALAGVWLISIGAVGHFAGRLGPGYRILFVVAGIGVLLPANAVPYGLWTDAAGAALGIVLILLRLGYGRRRAGAVR